MNKKSAQKNVVIASQDTLADRVRHVRHERKLTQRELADLADVSQQAINEIEQGNIARPRKIEKIAAVLGVSPAWLQFGNADQDDSVVGMVSMQAPPSS